DRRQSGFGAAEQIVEAAATAPAWCVRLMVPGDRDQARLAVLQRCYLADGLPGDDRSAEKPRFPAIGDGNCALADVRLDLCPDGARRTATAETDLAHRAADGAFGTFEDDAVEECHAFEHGERAVARTMVAMKADKCPSQGGIPVRGSLALQVGKEQERLPVLAFRKQAIECVADVACTTRAACEDVQRPDHRIGAVLAWPAQLVQGLAPFHAEQSICP